MTVDKMKYDFLKPFCPLAITEFGKDEKWAIEPDIYFMTPQRTNKPNVKRQCVL